MKKKISMMLLSSRRRHDAERRRSTTSTEVHQLPPRRAMVTTASGGDGGGGGEDAAAVVMAATTGEMGQRGVVAGRIVADGGGLRGESDDDDDDDGDDDHDDDDCHDGDGKERGEGDDDAKHKGEEGVDKDRGEGDDSDAKAKAKADVDGASSETPRSRRRHRRRARHGAAAAAVSAVCATCAAADFPRLLDWRPGQARPWTALAHVVQPALLPPSRQQQQQQQHHHHHHHHHQNHHHHHLPAPPPSPPPSTDGTIASFSFSSTTIPSASSISISSSSSSISPSASSSSSPPPPPPPPPPPRCPYCAFFRAMLGTDATAQAVGGNFTPYLRIRQAFERVDGVGERHELARSVLGEVMARHRALPRGFIVKADADATAAAVDAYRAVDAPAVLRGRVVTPLLDPAVPRCWLDYCRDAHADSCGPVGPRVAGLRLVDCRERRVVCADDVEGADAALEYVALSYVWGTAAADAAPLAAPLAADAPPPPLPERLPAVFADAVTLTLSLGLRYLWIDRYCFMPLDAAEQRRQVRLLGDVFSRAALTLVVAAGAGIHDGIRGVSAPRPPQLSLQTPTGLFTTTLARPDVEVAASPWASRAWTLHEGLLSRRRLVLAASQAYFQCRALHCHESLALPLRLAPGVGRAGRVFPAAEGVTRPARLREHIQAFMLRHLSRPADRLDAFRAVLRAYARIEGLPVGDLLGLPLFHPAAFVNVASVVSQTDRLAVGLGWIPGGRSRRPLPPPAAARRSPGDGADAEADSDAGPGLLCRIMDSASFPSWTWLAWKLHPGPQHLGRALFHFNLVGEASPVIDGVCAPPRMEMSVGFGDGAVLSWEIDGDAVANKAESIAFLRLRTYCADLGLRRGGSGPWPEWVLDSAVPLSQDNKESIEAWIKTAPPPPPPPPPSSSPPEHRLVAVLVSGRGWRPVSEAGTSSASAATALVCHHRGWDPAAPLVRLGAVSIGHDGFVAADDGHAQLKGSAQGAAHAESHLRLSLRELDLY